MNWNLLFLDIDGVLNGHRFCKKSQSNTLDKDKVDLLNTVIEECNCKIVISSAWRYLVHCGDMTLIGLDWLLRSHGIFCNKLIGITGRDSNPPKAEERGEQITAYLEFNNPRCSKYAVLDDLDLGITKAGHPLFKTESLVGLTPDISNALIKFYQEK